ncbi:hypothetical protein MRB53_039028 [Persea americana]|nr:hypothetical protein MRB53_039028 [Persea americana]
MPKIYAGRGTEGPRWRGSKPNLSRRLAWKFRPRMLLLPSGSGRFRSRSLLVCKSLEYLGTTCMPSPARAQVKKCYHVGRVSVMPASSANSTNTSSEHDRSISSSSHNMTHSDRNAQCSYIL